MMRTKSYLFAISAFILITLCFSCRKESRFVIAVRTFADNVLEKGADKWSGRNTPLLADGINIDSGQPIEYVYDGRIGVRGEGGSPNHWIEHNLASHQNLFRTFDGLTNLTGDKKYRKAAEKEIRYHFDSLRSNCGLLRWGGHQIVDLKTMKVIGHSWREGQHVHELKDVYPYYKIMWDVDREATTKFIRAFWNAHVLDWNNLEFNRHGNFSKPMGKLWDNEFKYPEPFFEGSGLTFLNTGSDMIYAGSMLYVLDGDEGALKWATLLAKQYVDARHPKTGLGAYQFSKPKRIDQPPDGPLTGTLTWGNYGDRAENQFGKDFPGVALEGWALFDGGMYTTPALMQMELAEILGDKGKDFLKWTVDGLKAYAKYGYDSTQNHFRPMWADGTDLTGYRFTRTGYYGPQGRELKAIKADESYLFTYARAYRLTKDPEIWGMVRSLMKGLNLGELSTPTDKPNLSTKTENSNPYALFALLELNRALDSNDYLAMAEIIGDNILKRSFYKGFFLRDKNQASANFNAIEPLALLSLEAALQNKPELVPIFSGGVNHFDLKTE